MRKCEESFLIIDKSAEKVGSEIFVFELRSEEIGEIIDLTAMSKKFFC
jgi:hypothetical protein